ncbi:phosphinothricin acetyltransferase [Halogranum gelatinilyticum]|uniref:Phosphinothricin acetyltransferase n=1 Tax=Halogranum gelatinilyticum TaxID=660521 RepID=A0A1G9Q5S4_9EURY|nr:arsinothricin resistance N-acetyltransferase ArsN1 family B [Halogranum gelatinilyticum]SDM06091.1 phosphinothricin acetyltransferase [Halogranum gelatinilyticum]
MSEAEIRLATRDDAEAIAEIYRPYVEETAITFELEPPTAEEIRERIEKKLVDYPWLVCEHEGRVVGYAYAGAVRTREAYQWSVESSVYVAESAHRNGVARGLYESLFALLDLQGYLNVYAVVTLPNPGSVALHEAFGFEHDARFEKMGYKSGAWHDVGWWSLSLGEHPEAPSPPTSLATAREHDEWTERLHRGEDSVRL